MPIKYPNQAQMYGLSLLQNQPGPNQAGVAGGIERALQPIIGALLMKRGEKQQAEAEQSDAQSMADALLQIQGGGDIGSVLSGNPRLAQKFGPALLGQQMEYNSPQAKYEREVSAYDRKGKEADALNEGVQNTMERSLARGDRANEMVNTRNFQRDQTQAAQDFQRQQQEDTQAFTAQENAATRAIKPATENESWGQPVTEADPSTGKPIVVRYSNRNGRQVVNGAQPAQSASGQPTADQARSNQLYTRAVEQLPIALDNFDALSSTVSQAGAAVYPSLASEAYQRGSNALNDIAASYLYSVSGATATPSEIAGTVERVRPRVGESAASREDKKKRLKDMVDSIKQRSSSPGAPQPAAAPQAAPKSLNWNDLQ